MKLGRLVVLAGVVVIAACEGGDDPPEVEVFKSDQSFQCEDGGIALETAQQELAAAGIDVLCAIQSNDGQGHPTVCGADTGRINLFRIRGSNRQDAEARGFVPATEISGYRFPVCTG